MPIVVPSPEENIIDLSAETVMQRNLTHWFIMSDPMEIALTPYAELRTGSGGVALQAQPPRETQTFRLIPFSAFESPVRSPDQGVQRKYDFTLLGEWNAIMDVNDRWTDEVGQTWVIDNLVSANGYERKGLVISYGKQPRHG
jgi:hypothetical protein